MKIKQILAIVLSLLVSATLLVGCGGPKDDKTTHEGLIGGTVQDASAHALEIQDSHNASWQFALTDDTLIDAGANGLLVGDKVVIHYTGELTAGSSDAQPVTVTKVTVITEQEGSLDGVLEDASNNTVLVKGGNGITYLFSTVDAEIQAGTEGLIVGDTVSVYFVGALEDSASGLQPVIVSHVVVRTEPENTLDGIVTAASADNLTVKNSHGIEYHFITTGAVITPGPNGLIVGDLVRVAFKGVLNKDIENQTVTVESVVVLQGPPKPEPKPAPAPAPAETDPKLETDPGPAQPSADPGSTSNPPVETGPGPAVPASVPTTDTTEHMISGIVTAWDGSSTLTIKASDGTVDTFTVDPSNIQAGSEHMGVGDNVSVFFNGLQASVSGGSVTANRVAISGWGGSYVEGFVSGADNGLVIIQIDDHNYLRFKFDKSATLGDASFDAGSYIKVFYYGTIDESLGQDSPQNVTVHGFGSAPAPTLPSTPALTPSVL